MGQIDFLWVQFIRLFILEIMNFVVFERFGGGGEVEGGFGLVQDVGDVGGERGGRDVWM